MQILLVIHISQRVQKVFEQSEKSLWKSTLHILGFQYLSEDFQICIYQPLPHDIQEDSLSECLQRMLRIHILSYDLRKALMDFNEIIFAYILHFTALTKASQKGFVLADISLSFLLPFSLSRIFPMRGSKKQLKAKSNCFCNAKC